MTLITTNLKFSFNLIQYLNLPDTIWIFKTFNRIFNSELFMDNCSLSLGNWKIRVVKVKQQQTNKQLHIAGAYKE